MADCNKTVEFIKEKARMCNSSICPECPLSVRNNGIGMVCKDLMIGYTDKAIAMVQQWSDEHPEPKGKTYLEDFTEKFPNADLRVDGTPRTCRRTLYKKKGFCIGKTCEDCWNEAIEE